MTDLTSPPPTPDYRFGTLVKTERFAYARGLLISPAHLPSALDAMADDGWHVVSVFGASDSQNVAFIFERRAAHPLDQLDYISDLEGMLRVCADQFEFYARNHRAKRTEDAAAKAVANETLAKAINETLSQRKD